MTSTFMLVAEGLVAVLLVACMVTCARLGRRIARLQADEASMRAVIAELVQATDNADRAITGLRVTLGECDRTLAERLRTAERYAADLANQVEAGETVMNRIMQIAENSRRAAPSEPVSVAAPSPAPAPAPPRPAPARAAAPEPIVAPRRPAAAPRPAYDPPPAPVAAPASASTSARISAAAELLAERVARRVARP